MKRKPFYLILTFIVLSASSSKSQTFYINSCLSFIHTNNASGFAMDHEVGYGYNLTEWLAVGPSLDFFYFPNGLNTTHVFLANANIVASKQYGRFIPFAALTGSLSRVFPADNGSGLCISLGSATTVTENLSFYVQVKYFKLSNTTDLGRFLSQMGIALNF